MEIKEYLWSSWSGLIKHVKYYSRFREWSLLYTKVPRVFLEMWHSTNDVCQAVLTLNMKVLQREIFGHEAERMFFLRQPERLTTVNGG